MAVKWRRSHDNDNMVDVVRLNFIRNTHIHTFINVKKANVVPRLLYSTQFWMQMCENNSLNGNEFS